MIVGALRQLIKLRRNVWRSLGELEAIQLRKLRALVQHAYANVPYYRRLFDEAGVRPDEIQDVRDLVRIPVTTKAQLQRLPVEDITDIRLSEAGPVERQRTSGSTGQPLDIYNYSCDRDYLSLVWARAFLANGVRLADRRVFVEDPHSFADNPRWFQRLGIWRKAGISCFDDLDTRLRMLRTLHADVLCGFPSSLAEMALAIADRTWDGVRPRLVFTRAELLDNMTRRVIEKGFDAPVRDFYGTTEHGLIAWECPEQAGYHINMDSVVVEFIADGRPAQPGESAELVCTALRSYAMPLIRYSVGDVGVLSDGLCPCGRTLPLMKVIEGRLVDCLHVPSGRMLSPYLLTCAIEKVTGIACYQVVQQTPEHIEVCVLAGVGWTPHSDVEVRAQCQRVLPSQMTVRVRRVSTLSPEPSGKFRVVRSNIKI